MGGGVALCGGLCSCRSVMGTGARDTGSTTRSFDE